ncbi:MAG: DUF853 family protein, partial [Candidatus Diapherotrites archaeon]|nr:DUF853 family protein [Candidatus Diapherotrites archaeon]
MAEENKAEDGTDLFEEVFGEEKPEKPVKKQEIAKPAEEENWPEESPEEGEPEPEESQGEEIDGGEPEPEEGEKSREPEEDAKQKGEKSGKKPRRKGRAKKGSIRIVRPVDEDEVKKGLREKIKKIVVAKAEKAAENEEMPALDRETGIKEEGIKEESPGEEPVAKAAEQPKPVMKPELRFLEHEEGKVFIGRKQSVYKKYADQAGLFIGEVAENDASGKHVYLDSLNPHVVFVCGARGSGKSYILGVIAEELALNNKNVGIIVVDPVGVFWSMRFPNRDERELQLLAKWNLLPQGLDNLKVFIPKGIADQIPKNTYDGKFSIPPGLLTTEDWCLTFGIERFSPSGLLLEKAIFKVKHGYKNKEGKSTKGKNDLFSLEELIQCLQTDEELNSSERGYKPDSIRALVSRFDAARAWGVFDEEGTPLGELSMENQLTIIDTSFLEDNVSALVIGLLARRILAARKVSTRQESAQRFKEERDIDKLLEYGIPPTWMFIDEAHTLIPSGNTMTPASNALIEYVKQGRQPGCSIVFATQQPSAINTKVLSQLDLMISHKLVFDDDIKAVYKRTPTIIPRPYKKSSFIKTLPVGVALTGDRREETSRAFVLRIRPRMSQHEGREAETAERKRTLGNEEVLVLAVEMAGNKLKRTGSIETSAVDHMVKTLNAKYSANLKMGDVLS